MGARHIVFENVVPALGVVLFLVMSASPTRTVWRTRKRDDIGEFNPLPSAVLVGNAVCWNAYALVTHDPFIACSSAGGLLIAVFNTVILVGQARQRTKDRLLGLLLVYLFILLLLGALTSLAGLSQSTVKTMWGVAANAGSIAYYTSPLATVMKVVRTRNSASIHIGNCACSVVNCSLWITYFVAKGDYVVPTSTYYIGVTFNLVCLALCWRFPRKKTSVMPQVAAELAPANTNMAAGTHPGELQLDGPAADGGLQSDMSRRGSRRGRISPLRSTPVPQAAAVVTMPAKQDADRENSSQQLLLLPASQAELSRAQPAAAAAATTGTGGEAASPKGLLADWFQSETGGRSGWDTDGSGDGGLPPTPHLGAVDKAASGFGQQEQGSKLGVAEQV